MAPTFTLYTATGSPNGLKAALILEELKAAYPTAELDYEVRAMDMKNIEQKEDWFLKINPNGRIPAVVHHRTDGTDFTIFESAAIILYLVQHFDWDYRLSFPAQSVFESDALQWIFFVHGGVGPMQGQAAHFINAAPEKIAYGISRYVNETKRLYSVLNTRLRDRDYLVGPGRGMYSVAEINTWPWIKGHAFAGIETLDQFPNLQKWVEKIRERPAVQIALNVPPLPPPPKTKEEEEQRLQEQRDWITRSNQMKVD